MRSVDKWHSSWKRVSFARMRMKETHFLVIADCCCCRSCCCCFCCTRIKCDNTNFVRSLARTLFHSHSNHLSWKVWTSAQTQFMMMTLFWAALPYVHDPIDKTIMVANVYKWARAQKTETEIKWEKKLPNNLWTASA